MLSETPHRWSARFEATVVTRNACILLVWKEYCKHVPGLGLQECHFVGITSNLAALVASE